MVNNKGFIKTLEAVLAIIITLAFVMYIIPQRNPAEASADNLDILDGLYKEETFRECVLSSNISCVNDTIDNNIPAGYEFKTDITSDPFSSVPSLPEKKVFSESVFISSNDTLYSPKIIRLYYWIE